ncbi:MULTISPECIES: DUF4351 domain-containing protein [Kamptonema]|uniref:DUF4351 domain-containing protein n=1 Tax=Kamptonema TaxID=1501433 RepID=UPI0001DAC892|nr:MULTISPECIES: DUF4351 domain-containing protein [Kamptonema]CBN57434.1 conserved hypothetical protein [Kamptonema sp. PCC 6506]
MIDHDRLFKELLSTFFREFVDLFLPDVSAELEPESLEFLNPEIFTDVTSGEKYQADLVVKAQFRGQESYFIIHLEHQARSEAEFGKRMFRYFARLYEKHGVPVYPVVIYSYDEPKLAAPNFHRVEFPGFIVLEFNYRAIQLNRLQWRDFENQRNPVASALMAKMQKLDRERPTVKLASLRLLSSLGLNPAQVQLISGFIDTYLKLSPEEKEEFDTEFAKLELRQQEGVMEIVTSWMEEGIQLGIEQGIERGIQRGIQQGELSLIIRLLTRRIGTLDLEIQEQIQRLSIDQLEDLGEALLDFSSAADLTNWLQDK